MKFAHFFVDRPIFAAVISIATVIIGIIAFFRLPVSEYPEIAPPTITVRAVYPGADAETMASSVAAPLEKQFSLISGLDSMTSSRGWSRGRGSGGCERRFACAACPL